MTPNQFADNFEDLLQGRYLVYHVGELGRDRENKSLDNYRDIHEIATMAYAYYEAGRAILLQKPIGPYPDQGKYRMFEYRAYRASSIMYTQDQPRSRVR